MSTTFDTIRTSTVRVGVNKNAPRVWLEGVYLLKFGFAPATGIEAEFAPNRVTLRLSEGSRRHVSSKLKRGRVLPVIDLNTQAIRDAFGACEVLEVRVSAGEITLTPAQTERLRADRCRDKTEGSFFGGVGLLSLAAKRAGFRPAFTVELDPRYAAAYEANHKGARVCNTSIEDAPLSELPRVGLLTMGIPCPPFSKSRTLDRGTGAKRDRALPPEAHPDGDLTLWAALAARAINPESILIEQVPGYLDSGAGFMMAGFLRRMGYHVESRVLDPRDYGELTGRRRAVIVAVSHGGPVNWPEPCPVARAVAEILDPAEAVEHLWFDEARKPWLFAHWRRCRAKGSGFVPPVLTAASTSIPTIKKRYLAQQGDGVVLAHPTREGFYRFLTLSELKRLHGVPEDYYLGEDESVIRAGEGIGQGVVVTFFEKLIRSVTSAAGVVRAGAKAAAARALPSQLDLGFAGGPRASVAAA